jgi:hypothetical protein
MKRSLLNLLAGLSLALVVAVALLWVRSYRVADAFWLVDNGPVTENAYSLTLGSNTSGWRVGDFDHIGGDAVGMARFPARAAWSAASC